MKMQKFIDSYNGAPLEMYEFACLGQQVEDDEAFRKAAEAFVAACDEFSYALDAVGVEIG